MICKFSQLTDFERGRIVGLFESGNSSRQVAEILGKNQSTVLRSWNRWQKEGLNARKSGSGAKRKTSPREDRLIRRTGICHRTSSLAVVRDACQPALDSTITKRTINNRMLEAGLRARKPLLRLPLLPRHKTARLKWCKERKDWTQEWLSVIFTDECKFNLGWHDGRTSVRRRTNERNNPACIVTRHTGMTRGIMFWGAISYDSRSPLIIIKGNMKAQDYINDVLRPFALPFVDENPGATFQQDNATPHSAKITTTFLQDVKTLPWPARSPDLSPIENVWVEVKRRVYGVGQETPNLLQLEQKVIKAWKEIPQEEIRSLYTSMPKRIVECLRAKGGSTSY